MSDVLEWLASGGGIAKTLSDGPDLEAEDLQASLLFAAHHLDHPRQGA